MRIAHARHKFGDRAIGEYIVSGAEGPEDVLAVLLLARWADITDKHTGECPLDVAPLLESVARSRMRATLLRGLHMRAGVSPPPRGARQSPMGRDRLFRYEQAGGHRRLALVIASCANPAAGSGARRQDQRSPFCTGAAARRRAAAVEPRTWWNRPPMVRSAECCA